MESSEEAKTFACNVMSGKRSREESEKWLERLRVYLEQESEERFCAMWRKQIEDLEQWLASATFRDGLYSQGVDALLLELVEWRALIYGFDGVERSPNPFATYPFFAQWASGAVYATHTLLGKLVSKDNRDVSLRSVWSKIAPFIRSDGACTPEEMDEIDRRWHGKLGQFTKERSHSFHFRNTVVAHNENSFAADFNALDQDIETLARIWSLAVSWSSFGLLNPFWSPDQAVSGLDGLFTASELAVVKARRAEYLARFRTWCATRLDNGSHDPGKTAFAEIRVAVQKVTP